VDFDAYADAAGWTEEERETVARRMVTLDANPRFTDFWLYQAPVATAPWPTYDETHHFKIPGLAAELGLVVEALAYERSSKNRASIIEALEAKLAEREVEAELTAA